MFAHTWLQFLIAAPAAVIRVDGTSVKMDFLSLADVRLDPVISPGCLSDHVHTFYGANHVSAQTTYEDLRSADGNSGNVKENPSLYWHPTVYQYDPTTRVYQKVKIWFASAYYVWETGATKAWPNAFKMIAYSPHNKDNLNEGDQTYGISHTKFECSAPYPCERDDCSTTSTFFPATGCGELEVSFRFPSCWDGTSVDSADHMSHVAYTSTGEIDDPCPATHPVRIPQVRFYFRILGYEGGHHEFSDGSSVYHADYMSGWNETFLQELLDNCQNPSETAAPDAFCEDILTFRGTTKVTGQQGDDEDIEAKLLPIQPQTPVDVAAITTEAIDNVKTIPRGICSGELLSGRTTTIVADSNSPTDSPSETSTASPTDAPSDAPTDSPTDSPTLQPDSQNEPSDAPDPSLTTAPDNASSDAEGLAGQKAKLIGISIAAIYAFVM